MGEGGGAGGGGSIAGDAGVSPGGGGETTGGTGGAGGASQAGGSGGDSGSGGAAASGPCDVDNGGCGDPAFVRCVVQSNAAPQCEDIDECAVDNGSCGDPRYFSCTDNEGAPPSCAEMDLCATDNGGCGAPERVTCSNNTGAQPSCDDIDECAVDNGGCGDEAFFSCTNHYAAQPSCEDIDECLEGTHDCAPAADCSNESPGYSCACRDGFTGDGTTCTSEGCAGPNPCAPGICEGNSGGYSCLCPCGFASSGGTCVDLAPHRWYVDADAEPGGDGQCWSTAFEDLNDALAVADAGDDIWVAEGHYYPGADREDTFSITTGVSVYGGFDGDEMAFEERRVTSNRVYLNGDIDRNRTNTTYTTRALQAGDSYHVVTANVASGEARLDGLTIVGGFCDGDVNYGAGVYLQNGALTLHDVDFDEQLGVYLQYDGASVYADGGVLRVEDSYFEASEGAIRADDSELDISDTQFSLADLRRAVVVNGGTATLTDCRSTQAAIEATNADVSLVRHLTTDAYSTGAVIVRGGGLTVIDSSFRENSADFEGGAIAAYDGAVVDVSGSTFTLNRIASDGRNVGAGIYGEGVSLTITDCDFDRNEAGFEGLGQIGTGQRGGSGGSLRLHDTTSEIIGSTFTNGYAHGGGGAIALTGIGATRIEGCLFSNNAAYNAGGAINSNDADLTIVDTTFDDNVAGYRGGALDLGRGDIDIVRCRFSRNVSDDGGGAIHAGFSNWDATMTDPVSIVQSTFDDHAAALGGVIFSQRHMALVQVASRTSIALDLGTNEHAGQGGALFTRFPITMDNSTFTEFFAEVSGQFLQMEDDVEPGAGAFAGTENVLWTSATGTWAEGPGTASFERSCVDSALASGTNVALSASPFVDLEEAAALVYELQLASDSTCKDQLASGALPVDAWDLDRDLDVDEALPRDLAELSRIVGPAADLGAFEERGLTPP